MIKRILISLAAIFLITQSSCDSTEPYKKAENPREYTWKIDTLNIPDAFQNLMRNVWAANSDDIYICGHNSGTQIYPGDGGMWHYDGEEWKVVKISKSAGYSGHLTSVHGSSPNNVWVVGYNGNYNSTINDPLFIHYNGNKWNIHSVNTQHALYDVYVENENSVWACGDGGLVYHFNGSNWEVDTIKVEIQENEVFQLEEIIVFNNDTYITGFKHVSDLGWGTLYFIKREDNKWKIKTIAEWGTSNLNFDVGLYKDNTGHLYSHGMGGIFIWENENWKNIFSISSSINDISIKSEDNILAVGSFGKVYHYNGTDWKQFENLEYPDAEYSGVLLFDDEAFIIGYDLSRYPMKTFILHGK